MGQARHERPAFWVAMHIREQLRERLRCDQIASRETRAVLEREGGGVDLHGVGQEAALDAQPRGPRALTLQLPPQDLEQHLGQPAPTTYPPRKPVIRTR